MTVIGPAYKDLTVSNPTKIVYIEGSEFADDAWRIRVEGDHPDDALGIEHREELDEVGIALDDAKVASVQADNSINVENKFYATVITDTRADQNVPPALAGNMVGRMVEWDGTVWLNFSDEWVSKATFQNSMFSDRGQFRRMNIVDTDPDDGLAYPPTPARGVTLGSRSVNLEATGGAHLTETTADGIFGAFPFMVHGAPEIFNISIDNISVLKADNTPVSFEYGPTHLAKTYELADVVVVAGISYLAKEAGPQTGDFDGVEISKWAPQDRDLVMDAALTTLGGDVLVDSSGDIIRGFSQ